MSEKAKRTPSGNQGIIGNVRADAVAVGTGARAVSNRTSAGFSREHFDAALVDLREQIGKLSMPAAGMEALRADLDKLKELSAQAKPAPERAATLLDAIVGKLKMVGVVVETMKPFAEPIKAIARLYGIPLPF
jgi:hypothetical protein